MATFFRYSQLLNISTGNDIEDSAQQPE